MPTWVGHAESPSRFPIDCTGGLRCSSCFTPLHLSHLVYSMTISNHLLPVGVSFIPTLGIPAERVLLVKQIRSLFFFLLLAKSMSRFSGHAADQVVRSNFHWDQPRKGCWSCFNALFYYFHPPKQEQMVSFGSVLLAGKHPFDWDAHSFTCLKNDVKRENSEKKKKAQKLSQIISCYVCNVL